jgi:hypothetical protein
MRRVRLTRPSAMPHAQAGETTCKLAYPPSQAPVRETRLIAVDDFLIGSVRQRRVEQVLDEQG